MHDAGYGREGYMVTLLQYALMRAGLDPGNRDGIFGRRTARALQRFQREKGLSPDGIAGKLTWAALYPYLTGYALHRVTPGDSFQELAQRYGVSVAALETANPISPSIGEAMTALLPLRVVSSDMPCTSLLTGLWAKGLVMRYPFLKVYEIGRSVMGRPLQVMALGSGARKVGCIAAHGADRGWTTVLLLMFLEDFAAAFSAGETLAGLPARALYEGAAVHVLPLVNPDGADLVAGALDPQDSYYAQAAALAQHYPDIPFPEGWRSNILGVDLSLQYSTGWEERRRLRFRQGYTRPGPVGFAGSGPLLAPESRAVMQWVQAHGFDRMLTFDELLSLEFEAAFDRPAVTLAADGGGEGRSMEDRYRELLPILARSLLFSP